MSYEFLSTGVVFRYPFLWKHQQERGETEGRKNRPVTVAVRIGNVDGLDSVILLPITSKMPEPDRQAFEIPDIEKRRTGLDAILTLWIIVDEANIDVIGRSYYLAAQKPMGTFSKAFFTPVVRAFARHYRTAMKVDRTL